MNDRSVAQAIADWLTEDLGVAKAYPYAIANATGPLPDAVIHVTGREVTDQVPEDLPELSLQQIWARIYTVAASIMVKLDGQGEDAADAADAALRAFSDEIEAGIWDDASLGGRLTDAAVGPRINFNYETPFARREDGVTGRFVVAELRVVEPIPAPS